ncbi:HlyD family secretion protein [Vibrio maritimus]
MKTREIFRREYIENQNDTLHGTILIKTGFKSSLWLILTLCLITFIVMFIAFGSYARKVQIEGVIVSSNGVIDVVSEHSGYVSSIYVSEGDWVNKGDNLFVVSHDKYDIEGKDITVELISSLQRQHLSIEQQIRFETSMSMNELDSAKNNKNLIQEELRGAQKALSLAEKRFELKRSEAESYKHLYDKEYISTFTYQGLLIDLSELESIEEEKRLVAKQLERQLSQLEYKLDYLVIQLDLRTAELTRLIDEIQTQIVELRSSKNTVVRAPVAGYVTGVVGEIGQPVTGNYTVASIIPHGSNLLVELYAPSHAIGFLREEQRVGLRFPAFPYEKFGIQSGSILRVSRSTLSTNDIAQLRTELKTGHESLFRILVSLDKETVTVYGNEKPLKIGMVVSADINVETRKLSEWLLGPISGLKQKTLWN